MKTYKTGIIVLVLGMLFSCQKKDELNKQPNAPVLKAPENGSVTDYNVVTFEWENSTDPENDYISYTLYISGDSLNWKSFSYVNSKITIGSSEQPTLFYTFDPGKKHFWKVKAENPFSVNSPQQEMGEAISKIFHFYTVPNSLINLRDTSGYEFVTLNWEDPENLDYIEIYFTPEVININQPLIIDAGTEELELTGLKNGAIYTFYLYSFNNLGHKSKTDTIKALPLDPTQVKDADLNIYNITKIGEQTWLRENLRTTKWQDGTPMANNYKIGIQSNVYGYYYSPYETFGEGAENKNPCPCGYHVPTDNEWKELERYLEMPEDDVNHFSDFSLFYRGEERNVGNILKTTEGWPNHNGANGNGIDFYMFNLLPAGVFSNGEYNQIGESSNLLSSTHTPNYSKYNYIYRKFSYISSGIGRYTFVNYASIRCIKD